MEQIEAEYLWTIWLQCNSMFFNQILTPASMNLRFNLWMQVQSVIHARKKGVEKSWDDLDAKKKGEMKLASNAFTKKIKAAGKNYLKDITSTAIKYDDATWDAHTELMDLRLIADDSLD